MMRMLLWALCLASLVGVWYASNMHSFFVEKFTFYNLQDYQLIQIVLSVLAGIFATKASDSSSELKELLKVKDIQYLLKKVNDAANQSEEEKNRLNNLVRLVGFEVEQQFAREMLINHRRQLTFHWEQTLKLESILEKEETVDQIDPKVKNIIQQYIIRTQYIEYMGKGFLLNIPFVGRFLDYIFGPVWNAYYLNNLHKFNKIFGERQPNDNSQQSA